MGRIKEISARYIGDIVLVNNNYNVDDVVVTIYYYDGNKEEIHSGFYVDDKTVRKVGINTYCAYYRGFHSLFCVRGFEEQNLKDIAVRRTNESILEKGDPVASGSDITKQDLDSYALYRRSVPKHINDSEDYVILNKPLADGITTNTKSDSNGMIKKYSDYCDHSKISVQYTENFETVIKNFTIPAKYKFTKLKIWYEGPAVPADKKPDFNDIRLFMTSHLGNVLPIPTDFPGISFEVMSIVDTYHRVKVTYTAPDSSYKLYAAVNIPVMKEDTKSNVDFKVIYVPDDDLDVTEQFSDAMHVDDMLLISWNKFYDIVKQTEKYGPYLIDVPKLSGLNSRHDQRWLVTVSPSALKASIIKNL